MRELLRSNRALVLLNLGLLCALTWLALSHSARAQNAAPKAENTGRPRGDYTMVSGRVSAGGSDAIYILDTNNQELVALRWDTAKQSLAGIGFRDLNADGKLAPGR
ncbi:MAG: hypothetical protein JSR77_12405 [Planctomycetes bacterium]|nr:hypothetical protein [Planctomycetota bacterium]